jgi:hypothetical protein
VKQQERDEVALAQLQALERVAGALEAPARAERHAELRASFPEPFKFLAGERGLRTMLRSFPGFAGLWEREVPVEYLGAVSDAQTRQERALVACPCGVGTVVEAGLPVECAGQCGRWFLALESSVRVKRFELDAAA